MICKDLWEVIFYVNLFCRMMKMSLDQVADGEAPSVVVHQVEGAAGSAVMTAEKMMTIRHPARNVVEDRVLVALLISIRWVMEEARASFVKWKKFWIWLWSMRMRKGGFCHSHLWNCPPGKSFLTITKSSNGQSISTKYLSDYSKINIRLDLFSRSSNISVNFNVLLYGSTFSPQFLFFVSNLKQ